LKQGQRDERDAFRETTKTMIREMRHAIYREVKEEFRNSWSDYFDRKSEGAPRETLREMRALIMEQQKEVIHSRQDEAIKLLRGERHEAYQFLLKDHREEEKEGTSCPPVIYEPMVAAAEFTERHRKRTQVMQ
jgi:hypothetical protein